MHPRAISLETATDTASFLRDGCTRLGLKRVRIDFHGGEPLLIGKRRFEDLCAIFTQTLGPIVELTLAIQTNATLIDEAWVDIFERHGIRVGVSLDGPVEYNDKNRRDFRGKGTYTQVVAGLRCLQTAASLGRINRIGVLCVIDPQNSARRIYRHFVDDLNVQYMDFLLPDTTYDAFGGDVDEYGSYLLELFDEWTKDDNPEVQIRTLSSVMSLILGGGSYVDGYGRDVAPAVTIGSDGSLQPNDLLRVCGSDMMSTQMTVKNASLEGFLESSFLRMLRAEYERVAPLCRRCCWLQVCGGGLLVHRYRQTNRFENPSLFCRSLQQLYSTVAAYLVTRGLPLDRLQNVLAAPIGSRAARSP